MFVLGNCRRFGPTNHMQPPPEFFKRLPEMPDEHLFEMLTLPEQYQPEALQAARTELQRRNVPNERIAQLDAQGERLRVERETRAKEVREKLEKGKFFAKAASREEALQSIKIVSYIFWAQAAIQAVVALFWAHIALADAVIVAALAGALFKWRSRTAAIVLAVIFGVSLIVGVLNLLGVINFGLGNVVVSGLAFLLALKAVQLTFQFHDPQFTWRDIF